MTRSTAAIRAEFSSATPEHYTPKWIAELARETMGGIDLDPASCAEANETIRATRFYTEADDGLSKPWHGRVFCNPPGDRRGALPKAFWSKLAKDWAARDIDEVIWLCFNAAQLRTLQHTEHPGPALLRRCAVCILGKRLRFTGDSPTRDNAVLYWGPNRGKFARLLGEHGVVWS